MRAVKGGFNIVCPQRNMPIPRLRYAKTALTTPKN